MDSPEEKRIIIGICGHTQSGKTMITNYLCDKYKFLKTEMKLLPELRKRYTHNIVVDSINNLDEAIRLRDMKGVIIKLIRDVDLNDEFNHNTQLYEFDYLIMNDIAREKIFIQLDEIIHHINNVD